MKHGIKTMTKRVFLAYAGVNVFTYLFAHVAYLFANDSIGEVFEYVSYYLSKCVEFLAPPILATLAMAVLVGYGRAAMIRFTLTVASARVCYSLPYYYIIFIYNYGYDSIESISISLVATVLVILLTLLGTLASLAILCLVLKKRHSGTVTEAMTELLQRGTVTDFLAPVNLSVLTFALTRFSFSLVMELIDTVSFFIEYRSDYIAKEIITILANFTLLFVLLTVAYLIAANIKNALADRAKSEE